MEKLIRLHLIYAALAAVAAISIPAYYWFVVPELQQLQKSTEFRDAVAKISDPEHLKKVVARVARDADSFVNTAKEAVDATIILLVFVLITAAAAFLHSYIQLRRYQRTSVGEKGNAL